MEFEIGDRFWIPQWEHTQHCGFAEIIGLGKGKVKGKQVKVRWPDLSESWVSKRQLERNMNGDIEFYGQGGIISGDRGVQGPIEDFWVRGEMEYLYGRNLQRLKMEESLKISRGWLG